MADVVTIPLGVRIVMDTMNRRAETLPSQWDEGGFCLDAAIALAQHIVRLDWRLPHAERESLLSIGGILLRSAYHQVEAGNLADLLMTTRTTPPPTPSTRQEPFFDRAERH